MELPQVDSPESARKVDVAYQITKGEEMTTNVLREETTAFGFDPTFPTIVALIIMVSVLGCANYGLFRMCRWAWRRTRKPN